jgi:class 3 adenylate cyclase
VGRAGTVTVMFTDMVGSTELISALGDDAWDALRREHLERLRAIVVRHSGEVIKTLGDGIRAAFGSAAAAIDAAADRQAVVAHENRRRATVAVGLRVGVSGGDATHEHGDWFGIPVVEAARLCALAAPGPGSGLGVGQGDGRVPGRPCLPGSGRAATEGNSRPGVCIRVGFATAFASLRPAARRL